MPNVVRVEEVQKFALRIQDPRIHSILRGVVSLGQVANDGNEPQDHREAHKDDTGDFGGPVHVEGAAKFNVDEGAGEDGIEGEEGEDQRGEALVVQHANDDAGYDGGEVERNVAVGPLVQVRRDVEGGGGREVVVEKSLRFPVSTVEHGIGEVRGYHEK